MVYFQGIIKFSQNSAWTEMKGGTRKLNWGRDHILNERKSPISTEKNKAFVIFLLDSRHFKAI